MLISILTVVLTIITTGWHITFTSDPLNTGMVLLTECKGKDGKLGFFAYDYIHLDPEWSQVDTRRQITPAGERCTVVATVYRNVDGAQGDPSKNYPAESSIIVEEQ